MAAIGTTLLTAPRLTRASQLSHYEEPSGFFVSRVQAFTPAASAGGPPCACQAAASPLPTVPAPSATFDGVLELANGRRLTLQAIPREAAFYAFADPSPRTPRSTSSASVWTIPPSRRSGPTRMCAATSPPSPAHQ